MANNQSVEKENKEDSNKYSNYLSVYVKDLKCEGYDFDPEKVAMINLNGQSESGGFRDVVLENGKRFKIYASTGSCGAGALKGKDSYKQLPDGCRFVIGDQCIEAPPTNCQSQTNNTCWDKDVKQDNELFQWEATNKGWERMTSFREYWEDDVE